MKNQKNLKFFVLILSIIGISISVFAEKTIHIDKKNSCKWFKYKKRKNNNYLLDSDQDLLTDYFETNLSLSDPNLPDSDQNGVSDADEDFDQDSLTNLAEQKNGMNPLLPAENDAQYSFYLLEKTIREDAESGNTDNWTIKGKKREKYIVNIVDPDNPENRVIKIKKGLKAQYIFKNYDINNIEQPERTQFKIEWDMKFKRSFFIFISCSTTKGKRGLYYSASKRDWRGRGRYVHHGLGHKSRKNKWLTVHRDLQKDLWDAQPDCNILSIDTFYIRGTGLLDNLVTLTYPDQDRDLLPDSVEDAIGTDKNNDSDALGDVDNDGINNLTEFYAGTLELTNINDEDNDGLDDDWEREHFGNLDQDSSGDFDSDGLTNLEEMNASTNPTKKDTDGDGMSDKDELAAGMDPNNPDEDTDGLPDGWEFKYFGNMNQTPEGDPDNDTVNNITEYKYGRHPNAGSKPDTENKMKLNISPPLR